MQLLVAAVLFTAAQRPLPAELVLPAFIVIGALMCIAAVPVSRSLWDQHDHEVALKQASDAFSMGALAHPAFLPPIRTIPVAPGVGDAGPLTAPSFPDLFSRPSHQGTPSGTEERRRRSGATSRQRSSRASADTPVMLPSEFLKTGSSTFEVRIERHARGDKHVSSTVCGSTELQWPIIGGNGPS